MASWSNNNYNANTGVGPGVLGAVKSGTYNTGFGNNVMSNISTGSDNTGVGYQVMVNTTNGADNTAVGYKAGSVLGAGAANNTILGSGALTNSAGATTNNAVVGYKALGNVTLGTNNVAIGAEALQGPANTPTTTTDTIAIGYRALNANTSGTGNTAVGTQALLANTTGTQNTAIGFQSLSIFPALTNVTAIGYLAGTGGGFNLANPPNNNSVILGNGATTIYAGTTTITLVSDSRDKANIEPLPIGLDFINSLNPVRFKFDPRSRYDDGISDGSKASDEWSTGFIAQELEVVQPDWLKIATKLSDDQYMARPGEVLIPLVKAVQELSAKVQPPPDLSIIQSLLEQVQALQVQVQALQAPQ